MAKLPTGYIELSYIYATGLQYIDTGFKPNNKTRIVADIDLTKGTADTGVFGARDSYNVNAFSLFSTSKGTQCQSGFGNSEVSFALDMSGRHVYDKNQNQLYMDDTLVHTNANATFSCSVNARLFQVARGDTSSNNDNNTWATAKMYSCKIYDQGNLIRDFVPCFNPARDVGMYDLVGKQFYGNSGKGTFFPGLARYKLPDGYTQLWYIVATGTQYIDTGFKPNQNTRALYEYQLTASDAEQTPFMGRTAVSNDKFGSFYGSATTIAFDYGTNRMTDTAIVITDHMWVDFNKTTVTYNGKQLVHGAASFQSTQPIAIMGRNTGGTVSQFAKGKMYLFVIYDNGTPVRHFVPCINDAGIVGMFDIINQQFYHSAGTAEFFKGPEFLDLPEGYIQLEFVQSSGEQYVDTGFMSNQDTQVLMDAQLTATSGYPSLFGSRNTNTTMFWLYAKNATTITFGFGKNTPTATCTMSDWLSIDAAKNVLTINGSTLLTVAAATFTDVGSLYLCAVDIGRDWQYAASMCLYSCKVYDDNTIVRNFVPCLNSAGIAVLFDLVNQVEYASATTTAFIAGSKMPQLPTAPKPSLPTPQNINLTLNDAQTQATCTWDKVTDATGYRVYVNGTLMQTAASTSYTFTVERFMGYVVQVVAYNNTRVSEPAEASTSVIPTDPFNWLVYDRTQADADRLKQLIQLGYNRLTDEQKVEWNSLASKGAWNCTDANRVGATINYIKNILSAICVSTNTVPVAPDTYNTLSDLRNEEISELQRSVALLHDAYAVQPELIPLVPGPNWKYTQANALEENLWLLYQVTRVYFIWPVAYDAICGGDYT